MKKTARKSIARRTVKLTVDDTAITKALTHFFKTMTRFQDSASGTICIRTLMRFFLDDEFAFEDMNEDDVKEAVVQSTYANDYDLAAVSATYILSEDTWRVSYEIDAITGV